MEEKLEFIPCSVDLGDAGDLERPHPCSSPLHAAAAHPMHPWPQNDPSVVTPGSRADREKAQGARNPCCVLWQAAQKSSSWDFHSPSSAFPELLDIS